MRVGVGFITCTHPILSQNVDFSIGSVHFLLQTRIIAIALLRRELHLLAVLGEIEGRDPSLRV